jgi:CheY-like chemotaxis protein
VERPPLRVLVVEDDAEQRAAIVRVLIRMGCRVEEAKDGAEAFRLQREGRPEVILMDLGLPSTTGWEAIRNIRERARTAGDDAPPHIIAYSAYGTADARREAFDAGCNEFVVKPLDVSGAIRAYALRHGHPLNELDDEPSTPA